MSAGTGALMLASIIHNTYLVCSNTAKKLKINPEDVPDAPEASKEKINGD